MSGNEAGQNGRGRKRQRKGKDRKAVQPVRSYPTRERAKAEAEVVAEVSLPDQAVMLPLNNTTPTSQHHVMLKADDLHEACILIAN